MIENVVLIELLQISSLTKTGKDLYDFYGASITFGTERYVSLNEDLREPILDLAEFLKEFVFNDTPNGSDELVWRCLDEKIPLQFCGEVVSEKKLEEALRQVGVLHGTH